MSMDYYAPHDNELTAMLLKLSANGYAPSADKWRDKRPAHWLSWKALCTLYGYPTTRDGWTAMMIDLIGMVTRTQGGGKSDKTIVTRDAIHDIPDAPLTTEERIRWRHAPVRESVGLHGEHPDAPIRAYCPRRHTYVTYAAEQVVVLGKRKAA